MIDRFVELEERIEKLEGVVRGLERRLSALDDDGQAGDREPEAPVLVESGPPAMALPGVLSLTGRTCLVLGGAFLIRAATEAHAVSRVAGAAAALVYAGIWLFLADRDGRRGRVASAAFHGVTAAGIAYPLLWETCARFSLLSPGAAVGAVALMTAILLTLSLRQPIEALAWAATLGALSTLFALVISTGTVAPVAGALILLTGATIWLAYGRRWHAPRWPAAVSADVFVLAMTSVAGKSISFRTAALLAIALPLICVPTFAVRTLIRRRPATPFEILQSTASLLIGFGVAMSVGRAAGIEVGILGVAALGVGLSAYLVAFAFVDRRAGLAGNFHFYTSLGLLMMIAGGAFWLSRSSLSYLWSALALGALILDARFHRETLRWHGAGYLVAAAGVSGVLGFVLEAFAGSLEGGPQRMSAPSLFALAAATVSFCILAAFRSAAAGSRSALPGLLVGIVALAGLGAVMIHFFGIPESRDGGRLAAVRTGVLATSSIVAALLGRHARTREISWLVYPLLALGGIKLLIEDVPRGRPLTLFVGFALFGTALLIAPQIARSGRIAAPPPG